MLRKLPARPKKKLMLLFKRAFLTKTRAVFTPPSHRFFFSQNVPFSNALLKKHANFRTFLCAFVPATAGYFIAIFTVQW
jgi:hypothetical protein